MMKLLKFRVTEFRSVTDSGWIDTDTVTSLIGTNESGKTNLIVPLWKLKPAKDGEINPITDYPRKHYNEIRIMKTKPVFITAHFRLNDELAEQISDLTEVSVEDVSIAEVKRKLDGNYIVSFPNADPVRAIPKEEAVSILKNAKKDLSAVKKEKEDELQSEALQSLESVLKNADSKGDDFDEDILQEITNSLEAINIPYPLRKSSISTILAELIERLKQVNSKITKPHPNTNKEARDLVTANLPSFVYYSNYGNLDSEIYLPHVIQNMTRTNLGAKEEAKVRTLKVLFEFVKLSPAEIRELGKEHDSAQGAITEPQIKEIAKKKTERDILLQSAGTSLTHSFKEWWKQGNYRFRFQADGDHFRIWVSDDKRPEDVELESRSTGLQWFLSFYLIFLVESQDSHQGAILLLDEPGNSLHPIAQKDLSVFFENLSKSNQLLYTTHSPFLVDSNHLDRVKAVYVDEDGTTKVSADLRAGEQSPSQTQSIYPVHAALGLSVSDTLLQGCLSVIVEGTSDQIYLSAIKNYLIGQKLINPKREIVFLPAGGVRGVKAIIGIITGKNDSLPYVILDSDEQGSKLAINLRNELYSDDVEKIVSAKELFNLDNAEVEDFFPKKFLADAISRYFRRTARIDSEDEFSDVVQDSEAILPQAESYAEKNGIKLEKGWKVEVSKLAKSLLLKRDDISKKHTDIWTKLFEKLEK